MGDKSTREFVFISSNSKKILSYLISPCTGYPFSGLSFLVGLWKPHDWGCHLPTRLPCYVFCISGEIHPRSGEDVVGLGKEDVGGGEIENNCKPPFVILPALPVRCPGMALQFQTVALGRHLDFTCMWSQKFWVKMDIQRLWQWSPGDGLNSTKMPPTT